MKDLVIGVCTILELVGFIVLCGIYGGIDQDKLTIAEGVKDVIIVGVVMLIAGVILYMNRDKEEFI